ncbi:MAG: cytochrome c [Alphaproteobacteria bacterium]
MQGRAKLIVLAIVIAAAAVAAYFVFKPAPQAPAPTVAQQAPSATPTSQSVETRVALMKELGGHAQIMSNAVKAGAVSAEVASAARATSAAMAKIPALFPAGTGDDKHPTTRAKADIWTKWASFEGYSKEGAASFAAVAAAAEQGDAAAFNAAFMKANESCSVCHKDFRGARR